MYMAIIRSLLISLSLWVVSVPATLAQNSSAPQKIQIQADHMEIDRKHGESIFTGNVDFRQGNIHITAQRIHLLRRNGQLKQLVVQGEPALFVQQATQTQPLVKSQALRMEYDSDTGILRLLEQALLQQGNNRFTGEQIEYDTAAGRVTATNQTSLTTTAKPE